MSSGDSCSLKDFPIDKVYSDGKLMYSSKWIGDLPNNILNHPDFPWIILNSKNKTRQQFIQETLIKEVWEDYANSWSVE